MSAALPTNAEPANAELASPKPPAAPAGPEPPFETPEGPSILLVRISGSLETYECRGELLALGLSWAPRAHAWFGTVTGEAARQLAQEHHVEVLSRCTITPPPSEEVERLVLEERADDGPSALLVPAPSLPLVAEAGLIPDSCVPPYPLADARFHCPRCHQQTVILSQVQDAPEESHCCSCDPPCSHT